MKVGDRVLIEGTGTILDGMTGVIVAPTVDGPFDWHVETGDGEFLMLREGELSVLTPTDATPGEPAHMDLGYEARLIDAAAESERLRVLLAEALDRWEDHALVAAEGDRIAEIRRKARLT